MRLSTNQQRFIEQANRHGNNKIQQVPINGANFLVFPDDPAMGKAVGYTLEENLMLNPTGLVTSTGSTPLPTYTHMQSFYESCSEQMRSQIARAKTHGLDEYIGVRPDDPHSYCHQTRENLRGIGIPPERIMTPCGWWPDMQLLDDHKTPMIPEAIRAEWKAYDQAVVEGANLALFGIGPPDDPHIGFNKAGTDPDTRIHLTRLAAETRRANARFFDNDLDAVPHHAVTLGMGTYKAMMRKPSFEISLIMANTVDKACSLYKTLFDKPEAAPGAYLCRDEALNEKLLFAVTQEVYQALMVIMNKA